MAKNVQFSGASAVSSDGVLQSIVTESEIKTLRETHQYSLEETRKRGKLWSKHKDEYVKLKSVLSTIGEKTTHKTMVPLGNKAYMEGTLVHTNEIMVLLGDNWFAERSASQASEICDRRINRCDEMMSKLNDELNLIQHWLDEAENLAKGEGLVGDQGKEIREPYDSDEEREWRKAHREKLKSFKNSKQKADSTPDDEELWKKLDELEIQEELDEYLSKEKSKKMKDEIKEDTGSDDEISDVGSEDWSESPELTEEEDNQDSASGSKSWTKINRYSAPRIECNEDEEKQNSLKCVIQENVSTRVEPTVVSEGRKEIEDKNNSKSSPNTRLLGHTIQKRTRRVSFGSISEYEYQRDGEYKNNKPEIVTRHSWSEHSTVATSSNITQSIPEQETAGSQSKSLSMEALAESLAKINAGKVLKFSENVNSVSTNVYENTSTRQVEATTSNVQDKVSFQSEPSQRTPTLFFTHFEEDEEEDEATLKIGRNEEYKLPYSYSDTTSIQPCDRDFVYDSVPKNPADILRLYGFRRSSIDRPRLKGILKPSGSSHSLAEDSSLADDASLSDNSVAKSPASQQSSSSGRFKVSPSKLSDNVVNTLLSSSPINSAASLRSSHAGSRFSISPTKISDPSIFSPPDKVKLDTHQLSVDSGSSPSRFSVKTITENTFVPPALEKTGDMDKEKENVPVNAIVQEKTVYLPSNISQCSEKLKEEEFPDGDVPKYAVQESSSGKKRKQI